MTRRFVLPLIVGAISVSVGLCPSQSAAAATSQCATAGRSVAPSLWAQQLLAPADAWALTRGGGQKVAVLDSGVDANAPQLRGRVTTGYDAITGGGRADTDCLGSGTHVAGAVAAAKTSSTGIYGVSPGATIVPIRVIGEPGPNVSAAPTPAVLARGITWATDHHADVIDISVWLTTDDQGVRLAVSAATDAGITVVAAVGDLGSADDGNPPTYPASYPGVIGVAAIDVAGTPWASSEHGSYVDLVAPGVGVPALQRRHGLVQIDGSTALAAGFVSGTAALVGARRPTLSGPQISDRLLDTASPTSGGPRDGHGIVNPYLAVTANLSSKPPAPMPGLRPATRSDEQLEAAAARRRSRMVASELTAVALGALLIVTFLAVGLPRARRRAWRAIYSPPPVERLDPIEPVPLPALFDEATSPAGSP
jgi:membrane-anchored mycosin MYCP